MSARSSLLVASLLVGLAQPGVGADLRVAPEEHCVVFVVDQEPDGKLITTDPVCFPSQNETDAYGRTWLRSVSPAAVSPVRRTGLALASFTLGTHYDGANGTGSSISVVGVRPRSIAAV